MLNEEQQFIALKAKILKDRGLDFGQYKPNYLKRRIAVRMRAHGVESYREYMKILDSDTLEYNKLMDCLTINVTQFFRDPATFEALEKVVLPQLVSDKQNRKSRVIRAWSAGCASGEEPFSLAILLSEVLGNKLRDFTVSIYATDIDEESLKKAERGEYEGLSMEGLKKEYLDRYFTYAGRYKIKDEIKRSVRFKRHDLISEKALTHFDIILCRNALIYFSRDMQEKLFTQFHQGLNKEGYLVIGKTETLTVEAMKMFRAVDVRERIYQKL